MRLALANIRNLPDMSRNQVRADAHTIRDSGADVVLLNEIGEVEDYQDIQTTLGSDWVLWTAGARQTQCEDPIAFDTTKWEVVPGTDDDPHTGRIKIHDGHAKISPTRYLWWVDLRRKWRPDVVVRFINSHFVAHVWGSENARRPDHALRAQMWNTDWEIWSAFIVQSVLDGYAVVAGGDFNRGQVALPPLKDARWVISTDRVIDKALVVDGLDCIFGAGESGSVALNSDHDLRWCDLHLIRRRELTPTVEQAAKVVADAWSVPGLNRLLHHRAQQQLRESWPTLGHALDVLAEAAKEAEDG